MIDKNVNYAYPQKFADIKARYEVTDLSGVSTGTSG